MTKQTYSDLLKDPRWQKKRLEIMQRDGFMCQKCHDKCETLHVHHKQYKSKTKPWDYLDDDLITLCELCHIMAGTQSIKIDSISVFLVRNENFILKIFKYPNKPMIVVGGSNSNYYPVVLKESEIKNLIEFLSK
jgi:hypothetical protein